MAAARRAARGDVPEPDGRDELVETIERHKLQLLITTPTFLRAFLRKAKPEQLRSLKMTVTGAEKLPLDLLREFEAKFGIQVSEGYGMTEASPVVACNLFDDPPSKINPEGVLGRRVGSVGRMVPGLSARIRDPETDQDLGIFQSGMLWLRGANVSRATSRTPTRPPPCSRTAGIAPATWAGWMKTASSSSRAASAASPRSPARWCRT